MDFCKVCVNYLNTIPLYVRCVVVWDLNTCLGHSCSILSHIHHFFYVGSVNAGFCVGPALGFKPSWGWLARDLSRCWRVYSEAPSSGLSSQKNASCWPWSQSRKRCHGTTLTHRCFLIQAQGKLLQLKPNCLQSETCLCIYECAWGFLPSSKQAHMRQCM